MPQPFDDTSPLFLQLAELIREQVLSRELGEGDSLPSVRQIAHDLSVNHQTVLKAIQVLTLENIIEKRRGIGMFVKAGALKALSSRELQGFIEKDIVAFADRAKLLDLTMEELLALVRKEFEGK